MVGRGHLNCCRQAAWMLDSKVRRRAVAPNVAPSRIALAPAPACSPTALLEMKARCSGSARLGFPLCGGLQTGRRVSHHDAVKIVRTSQAASGTVVRIATVQDLASLPEDQLAPCLKALRLSIQRARGRHALAVRSGALAKDDRLQFDDFNWRPRSAPKAASLKLSPETPIDLLELRPRVEAHLRKMKVLCLEDLSAVTESELRRHPDIGEVSVAKMRSLLNAVSLHFLEETDPTRKAFAEAEAIRAMAPSERTAALHRLSDDCSVGRLGLSRRTLDRVLRRELFSVGELRKMTPTEIAIKLGRQEGREIVFALSSAGKGLACQPSELDLWHAGLLDANAMQRPSDAKASVLELQPWLGAIAIRLHISGVLTLAELELAWRKGALASLRGMGRASAARLAAVMGWCAAPEVRRT